MKRTILVVMVTAVALLGSVVRAFEDSRLATVIGIDLSRSMRPTFPEMRDGAIDLISKTPDGAMLAIVEIGVAVTPVMTVTVTSATRAAATEAIMQMAPNDSYTDLGAAIATAASTLSLSNASHRRMFLFTDADPMPKPGSPFAGKSLAVLLATDKVLPANLDLFIVLPKATPEPTSTRQNVHFVRPGQWPVEPEPVVVSQQPVAPPSTVLPWTIAVWVITGTTTVVGIAALVAWRRKQVEHKAERLALEERRPAEALTPVLPPAPQSVPGFLIRANVGDVALHAGAPALEVGGQWNAVLYLPEAGDAATRLSVTARGRCELHNTGTATVSAGALVIQPGDKQVLPFAPVHLRLGAADVLVMPSHVFLNQEEANAVA